MVFTILDENVTFRTEREDCGHDRYADGRAARDDRDAADRKRARGGPGIAFHEAVEHVERAELGGDDRFELRTPYRPEKRVEGMVDRSERVAGPRRGSGVDRGDDRAHRLLNHRFISS